MFNFVRKFHHIVEIKRENSLNKKLSLKPSEVTLSKSTFWKSLLLFLQTVWNSSKICIQKDLLYNKLELFSNRWHKVIQNKGIAIQMSN